MTEVTIEKGIDIPKQTRRAKYPWTEMEIGDSFRVDGQRTVSTPQVLNGEARKFVQRRLSDEKGDYVRVWRTE